MHYIVNWNGYRTYYFSTMREARNFAIYWLPFEPWIDMQLDLPDVIRGDVLWALYENYITTKITCKV